MKLVRDKIPDVIKVSGCVAKYHFATNEDYPKLLYAKMVEELEEFEQTPSLEEAADMLEVFVSMLKFHKLSMDDVEAAAREKRSIR